MPFQAPTCCVLSSPTSGMATTEAKDSSIRIDSAVTINRMICAKVKRNAR